MLDTIIIVVTIIGVIISLTASITTLRNTRNNSIESYKKDRNNRLNKNM